jgi:hypothetical protein
MARFKRFAFLLACLLIFPALGHASSFSHSEFSLWNFQISPESGDADALFNDGASYRFASADDSTQGYVEQTSGGRAILPLEVSSGSATASASYAWFYPHKMGITASADVSLPDSTTPIYGDANGVSFMRNSTFFFYIMGPDETEPTQTETNVKFSFNYNAILEGFSSDAYGYFDSSLSVNFKITEVNFTDAGDSIETEMPLFALNDGISGRNTHLTKGGDNFFQSDNFNMSYDTLYRLDWEVDAKASASIDPTPEPSTIVLLISGLAAVFFVRRSKNV